MIIVVAHASGMTNLLPDKKAKINIKHSDSETNKTRNSKSISNTRRYPKLSLLLFNKPGWAKHLYSHLIIKLLATIKFTDA